MLHDIAPHEYDITYRTDAAEEKDIILVYGEKGLLCSMADELDFPTAGELSAVFPQAAQKAGFLFRIDDTGYFELRDEDIQPFGRWQYFSKESFRTFRPLWKAFAAVTGMQIHEWYGNTQYCGRCGSRMEHKENERAMVCPDCGRVCYPQICPSVIVGVISGEKLLLTKYSPNHSAFRKYALIAGYAETGESLEDTVRREVMEEVGLKVKNIRYYKSQPWPFSGTLLVGYFCELDGDGTIDMDTDELSVAEWVDRQDIPEDSADPSVSLTGDMMWAFRSGLI